MAALALRDSHLLSKCTNTCLRQSSTWVIIFKRTHFLLLIMASMIESVFMLHELSQLLTTMPNCEKRYSTTISFSLLNKTPRERDHVKVCTHTCLSQLLWFECTQGKLNSSPLPFVSGDDCNLPLRCEVSLGNKNFLSPWLHALTNRPCLDHTNGFNSVNHSLKVHPVTM